MRLLRGHMRLRMICRKTTVVAVTGSCAKTSTTAFLGKIFSDRTTCFVGVHFNSRRPVLRNVLNVKPSQRIYLQEVSGGVPGSLVSLMRLLRPRIAIVTTIGLDHYVAFRSLEAVAKEKGHLVSALPASGTAVLNADDPYVLAMAGRTKARVLIYGRCEGADVRATEVEAAWPQRLSLTINYQGVSARIKTNLFGDLAVTSLLAAVAGGLAAGFDLETCAESLQGVEAFERRMALKQTPNGIWFVDDTLKAPYWSVEKVVALFEHATAPRKTLVFGSFSDTSGSDSPKYRATARTALAVADRVVFVGKKAQYIRKMMTPETEGRLFVFDTPKESARFLVDHALKDELVLVKSNCLEHLERLILEQAGPVKCWKEVCSTQSRCDQCEASGILANGV